MPPTLGDVYELLIFIHVLAGFLWVGGGLMLMITFQRVRSAEGDEVLASTVERIDRATSWVFVPTPLLVLLTGIGMVLWSDAWDFSQMWVYLAIAGFGVTAILGGAVGGRLEGQMRKAREEGVVRSDLFDRYQRLFWAELPVLIAIVALMVVKPGG